MALNKKHLKRKYADINKEHIRWLNIRTPSGKQKFTDDYIIEKIAYKFYLSESTVEEILKRKP